MKKRLIVVLLFFSVSISAASCSEKQILEFEDLYGTWYSVSTDDYHSITFCEDKTYLTEYFLFPGAYQISDGSVKLVDGRRMVSTLTPNWDENELLLIYDGSHIPLVFSKGKKSLSNNSSSSAVDEISKSERAELLAETAEGILTLNEWTDETGQRVRFIDKNIYFHETEAVAYIWQEADEEHEGIIKFSWKVNDSIIPGTLRSFMEGEEIVKCVLTLQSPQGQEFRFETRGLVSFPGAN